MTESRPEEAVRWLARWGFGALVIGAMVLATWTAFGTPVLPSVPDFALGAAAVYRLEVGSATFAALYFASMAIVLALNNQAFTELGTGGMAAGAIGKSEEVGALEELQEGIAVLQEEIVDKPKHQG